MSTASAAPAAPGRSGESFTIVSPGDSRLWDAVLKRIGKDVEPFKPDGLDDAIGEARSRGPAPSRDRFDRGRGRAAAWRDRDRERGPPKPRPSARMRTAVKPLRRPAGAQLHPAPMPPSRIAAAEAPPAECQEQPRRRRPSPSATATATGTEAGRDAAASAEPGDPRAATTSSREWATTSPLFFLRSLGSREDA